jgi:hypothetical protein
MKTENSMSKPLKIMAREGLCIWESQYFLHGYRTKRDAKRSYKRAQRRLSKGLIGEQANG